MKIRKAEAHEMLELWGYSSIQTASSNAKFFCDNIQRGNTEFWALDYDGELVGELYVFYDLEDKDFADGKRTAYLCAFRIRTDLRGQGLGTKLICHVIEHIQDLGYQRISIGVDTTDMANIRLYTRLGFNIKVKVCSEDPCDRDENMQPRVCPCFWLLYKEVCVLSSPTCTS